MSEAAEPQDALAEAQSVREALRVAFNKYTKATRKSHADWAARVVAALNAADPAALALIAEHSPSTASKADHAMNGIDGGLKFADWLKPHETQEDPTQ